MKNDIIDKKEAYTFGWEHFVLGVAPNENPFDQRDQFDLYQEWRRGYYDAECHYNVLSP